MPAQSWYENKKSKKSGQDDDQVMRAILGVMRKLALALYQVGARPLGLGSIATPNTWTASETSQNAWTKP